MSTTVASYMGGATPLPWNLQRGFFSSGSHEDQDPTPVGLSPTAPALRDAFIHFSETFEPIHDLETVRVVLGSDFRCPTLLSNASATGRLVVMRIGEVRRLDPNSADPLAVFEYIQEELGVTQKDLLTATGIKRRTFYSWKDPSTPRPRPSSLGRLWHLADTLVDLREAIARPIAAWLHSSAERREAFKEGRFEDLLDLAVAMSSPAARAYGTSNRIGVASDVEMPVVKTKRPTISAVERGVRP